MDKSQMTARCSSAEEIGIGKLNNFDIIFNRKGSYRAGGVASIQPSKGNLVYGVIWQINRADLLKLDEIEDPAAYDRQILSIETLEGPSYDCFVYIAKPQGVFKPDKEYLKLLLRAAKSFDFPTEYIKKLETLSH